MKFIEKVKRWPIEKKRVFSILVAIFLTVFVIILNSGINLFWKEQTKNRLVNKNNPISSIQESFSKIFDQAKPMLDQALSSSTEIIDQINSTTSSSSTTSDVI